MGPETKGRGMRGTMAMAVVGVAATLSACGGGGGSLNPFSSNVGEIDTVFLAAAGSWDRNRDGVVTCDEWKAYAAELFDGADTNRDGMLTPEEFVSIVKIDRMFETADFKYWDANSDGKITRAEFVDRANPAFTMLDKQKTCRLTSTELTGGRQLLNQQKPVVTPPGDPTGPSPRGGR